MGVCSRTSHCKNAFLWKPTTLHELSGDSCDDSFCDSCYSSGFSDLLAFFLKPDLELTVSSIKYRPVPSNWHDKGKTCHVVSVRLTNKGRTANSLEAMISIKNLLNSIENLHWNLPSHNPDPPLSLQRLQKWGHAGLAIAYIIPDEKLWKLDTAESSFLINPHIFQNDMEYIVGVTVSHEPSRVDTWGFTLTLHANARADIGTVHRVVKG